MNYFYEERKLFKDKVKYILFKFKRPSHSFDILFVSKNVLSLQLWALKNVQVLPSTSEVESFVLDLSLTNKIKRLSRATYISDDTTVVRLSVCFASYLPARFRTHLIRYVAGHVDTLSSSIVLLLRRREEKIRVR